MNKAPWNKSHTKFTHPSVLKISKTLASKSRSNFYKFQQRNKPIYHFLRRGVSLAELYGAILGDGCIEKFPRTESLIISFNSKEKNT